MWVAFANAKATHIFFSKNISIYAIFNDQSFNDTLTNDIVSLEQLGPENINCIFTKQTQSLISQYTESKHGKSTFIFFCQIVNGLDGIGVNSVTANRWRHFHKKNRIL